MRLVRAAGAASLALLAALALLGPAAPAAGQEAPTGSTLRVGLTTDLYTSNPLRACGCGAEYEWLALNYDMLLRFDRETLGPAPGLATEVPTVDNGGISADGLTYTFRIRPGVTWSDGEPVTSRDVAFTYRFILDNGIGAYDNYLPFDPTFETPDDATLVWRMSEPNLSPLSPPWIPILPEHIWSTFDGDARAAKRFENIPAVGSGPFHLVAWDEGRSWTVEANPDYWDGAPKVDRIVFTAYENVETLTLALRDGELDLVSGLTPTLADSLDGVPDIAVHEAQGRGFMNLAFNFGGQGPQATNHPALADLAVREAIAYAIDKEALVERVLLGRGVVGQGLMPPRSPWFWTPPPGEERSYDPGRAADLLDGAGYLDTDGDGVREMPGGGLPLAFEFVAINSVPSAVPSAKLIADWLGEIGIDVTVKPVGDGGMNEAWGAGDFDALLWGWNPDPDPDFILSIFTTDECLDWSDGCYSDPAYDALYRAQQIAATPEERAAVVAEMEAKVYADVAELVLYYESDLEAYRTDRFEGFTPVPAPDGYMVFGYLPYPYMDIRPIAAGAAPTQGGGIPPWVIGLAVLGVLVGVLAVRARRATEDERN